MHLCGDRRFHIGCLLPPPFHVSTHPSRQIPVFLIVSIIVLGILSGCHDAAPPSIEKALDVEIRAYDGERDSLIHRVYREQGGQPIWLTKEGPTNEARALLRQLCEAPQEGLPRERYNAQALLDTLRAAFVDAHRESGVRADSLRLASIAGADVALTRAFLTHARDLTEGRLEPNAVQGSWNVEQDRVSPVDLLDRSRNEGVHGTLDNASAQHLDYAPLRDALNRYRRISDRGGWATIPDGMTLAPGDTTGAVARLRDRLAATGDLQQRDSTQSRFMPYGADLERAVERFQRRHGLTVSGAVDDDTRQAMNVSAHERVRQLALNLERHRWLPENLGQDFIFVNIMDFRLNAYSKGDETMEMPVIVGERDKQTTAFADTMQYVVFGPYWNIPREIAIEEILPKVKSNPSYLKDNNYQVVNAAGDVVDASLMDEESLQRYDVRLREKPGPTNSLGLVKFMFPNDHDIYLHDTPADHLFQRTTRTFSHGCVRVERPAEFARHVLPDDWSQRRVRDAMDADERKRVSLDHRLPVYLIYLTAWAEPDGAVHFRRDLYGHDPKLQTALDEPERRPASCTRIDAFFEDLDRAAERDRGGWLAQLFSR